MESKKERERDLKKKENEMGNFTELKFCEKEPETRREGELVERRMVLAKLKRNYH